MFKRHYRVGLLYLVAVLILGVSASFAQEESAVCTALQSTAFAQTGTLCATTPSGSVCYGHPNITAAFEAPTSTGFFSRPGDQAELSIVEQITTAPANTSVNPNELGVVLLNVQANLPTDSINGPLKGKGAMYIVTGGIQLNEATPPEDLVEPLAQGIAVSTIAEADLRVAPVALDTPTSTNVIARIPAESEVSADAVTPDGDWVRVIFSDLPGWVSRAVIDASANLSELAVVGSEGFTPMQSVTIAPAGSSATCTLLAGMLVQGPETLPVDLRVNGVDVRISSTVFFVPVGNTLEIYVISGLANIFPNDPARRIPVPPGFKIVINLSDLSFVGGENGVPYFVMTDQEMDNLNLFTTDIPSNIVHYIPPLLERITPSGVGQALVLIEVIDRSSNVGVAEAARACADGDIPTNICAMLGL